MLFLQNSVPSAAHGMLESPELPTVLNQWYTAYPPVTGETPTRETRSQTGPGKLASGWKYRCRTKTQPRTSMLELVGRASFKVSFTPAGAEGRTHRYRQVFRKHICGHSEGRRTVTGTEVLIDEICIVARLLTGQVKRAVIERA